MPPAGEGWVCFGIYRDMIFLLGVIWLVLGIGIFLMSAISGIAGVRAQGSRYLVWFDEFVGKKSSVLSFLYAIFCVIVWPVHLGLILIFK